MLAFSITGASVSRSLRAKSAKAWPERPENSTVNVSRRLRTSGSWPTAFNSAVNFSTMLFGTPIGATHPNQACTLEALQRLGDGRNIRPEGVALGRGDGECTDFPSLDLFPGGGEVIAGDLDLAANEILHLLVRSPICHGIHLDAGGLYQHLAAKVLARTVAGCGVGLIGIGLNPGDELRQACCRDRGMHDKQVGLNGHQVKIGEVLVGVVAEVFLHDRRVDGKPGGGANADRVTVRGGLRQACDADDASGAHAIFDHELLTETRG